MLAKVPLPVLLSGMVVLSVSGLFVNRHLPHGAAIAFNLFAIFCGVVVTLRAFQDRKAMRARPPR